MKATRYEGSDSRRVLIGMITDKSVVGRISAKWDREGLFSSVAENLVAGWCVSFHRKYQRAIGKEIQQRFEEWMSKGVGDDATVQSVGKLLGSFSDEYERNGDAPASDVVLDVAGRLFNKVRLRKLFEEGLAHLDAGDAEKVWSNIAKLRNVDLGFENVIKTGESQDSWADVFDDEQQRPLIWYDGALGVFLNRELVRDSFVVLTGAAKRGKSYWLLDMAYRAVAGDHHRVVYFEAGDLSRRQIMLRAGRRALRRPGPDKGGKFDLPVRFIARDKIETDEVELSGITQGECLSRWNKVQRGRDLFRLCCYSNSSLTVAHMEARLQEWSLDGWVPDAVVLDYADILAPPVGVRDFRDQINENWKALRRMSQDHHCLVITATQSDAASYDAKVLRKKNFSDDRRKHDHVTAMIGLNASEEDKRRGVMRLNFIDRREGAFIEGEHVWVAGCLDIACPAICSIA